MMITLVHHWISLGCFQVETSQAMARNPFGPVGPGPSRRRDTATGVFNLVNVCEKLKIAQVLKLSLGISCHFGKICEL